MKKKKNGPPPWINGPGKENQGKFPPELLAELDRAGLDTSGLLWCCAGDMNNDGAFQDAWLCFDGKGLYIAYGSAKVDRSKKRGRKLETTYTVDLMYYIVPRLKIRELDRVCGFFTFFRFSESAPALRVDVRLCDKTHFLVIHHEARSQCARPVGNTGLHICDRQVFPDPFAPLFIRADYSDCVSGFSQPFGFLRKKVDLPIEWRYLAASYIYDAVHPLDAAYHLRIWSENAGIRTARIYLLPVFLAAGFRKLILAPRRIDDIYARPACLRKVPEPAFFRIEIIDKIRIKLHISVLLEQVSHSALVHLKRLDPSVCDP